MAFNPIESDALLSYMDIAFSELSLSVNGSFVLAGVTGCFRHGRLAGVMGPSGSGEQIKCWTFFNLRLSCPQILPLSSDRAPYGVAHLPH
jgi:hypothetical protein